MPLRVLQIIPSLDKSGTAKQCAMLAGGLAGDRFDVHVGVLGPAVRPRDADAHGPGPPGERTLDQGGNRTDSGQPPNDDPIFRSLAGCGLPVTFMNQSWKVDPAAWWRLRRWIRQLRPDIVQTWSFTANCYGRTAARSAGARRIVVSEQCADRWKVASQLTIDRHLAKRTDRIVANSPAVVDFYCQHGIDRQKFAVIPNGVADPPRTGSAEPPSADADESRSRRRDALIGELGLPPGARLIGAVGRLCQQKRYKDLIWATDLLKCVRDDTHLLIVGDGPQRWRLERYRDQIGIDDKVHFLGLRHDVGRLLNGFDCFWLGSAYEGLSNALMEAMLAGLPVIASDIPGNRDLIRHERNGFLVRPGDRANFARHTNQLLADPALATRLGTAARQTMLADFTADRMVERYATMYEEILA